MRQIYKKNRTIFCLYMSTSLSVFSQDAKDIQNVEYYDLPTNLHKADKKKSILQHYLMCNMLFYLSLKGMKRVIYTRPSSSREVHLRLSCRMRV